MEAAAVPRDSQLCDEPHRPGRVYPPGTRYSDSTYYDVATDRFVHGFQVFTQHAPDGTPTGRQSILDNNGLLCGLATAEAKRQEAIRSAAPAMLHSLRELVQVLESAGLLNLSRGVQLGQTVWYVKASDALDQANSTISKAAGHAHVGDKL